MHSVKNGALSKPNRFVSVQQLAAFIRLFDDRGRKLDVGGLTGRSDARKTVSKLTFNRTFSDFEFQQEMALSAVGAGKPPARRSLRFVLDVPTDFVQTQVPFSFSDLPLP